MRLRYLVVTALLPVSLHAQARRDAGVDWLVSAGSEGERYLRVLQVAGAAPQSLWMAHGAGAMAIRSLLPTTRSHPWAASFSRPDSQRAALRPLLPEAAASFNSRFPFGSHDGAVWAGRGLTASVSLGAAVTVGPLEVTIAPVLFRAQNADFPITPNQSTQPFANAVYPFNVDAPQRFGSAPYQRLDPGQSTIRLHVLGLAGGATTANEIWGPAIDSPFLLSDNAAGFVRGFVGTDGPVVLGPLLLSARAIAGRLDQSEYSTTTYDRRRRYASGFIASMGVRQLPHLELGAARILANSWPDSGVSIGQVLRPIIQGPFKVQRKRALGNGSGDEPDNQLASVFGRWAFPASGFELYGEYGREDNAYDVRDLIVEPDHDVTYSFGFQRAWSPAPLRLRVVRGEIFDSRRSHLDAVRGESPPYVHGPVTQGHTQIGQFLGAQGGLGGGAHQFAYDEYSPAGRRTIAWSRYLRASLRVSPSGFSQRSSDAVHSLAWEQLRFGSHVDVKANVTAVYEFNREGADDSVNWHLSVGIQPHW